MISLTILGCGTSTGVPLLHCKCKVCRSKNPRNQRLRSSAFVQTAGKSLLIDTSPDLREQTFRFKLDRIDAVLYTHPHADHCHGIDELRSFNFVQRSTIPVYGNEWTINELTTRFPYIFRPGPMAGGGIPALEPHIVNANESEFETAGVSIKPVALTHGRKETLGYRIGKLGYVIDCNSISNDSLEKLRDLSVLVLDCLRFEPEHDTHMVLRRSLEVVAEIKPKRTLLTHMGHDFDYTKPPRFPAPKGCKVELAYDGMRVSIR
jgi:phosphoribosyl 1,2-cyclic phosphate phosphodiesterase